MIPGKAPRNGDELMLGKEIIAQLRAGFRRLQTGLLIIEDMRISQAKMRMRCFDVLGMVE